MSGPKMTSTGRGGAGNIGDATKSPTIKPADLETPTLKSPIYTTGRGGSGNMANNDSAAEARLAQDVAPVERKPSGGITHVGRGGAANVAKKDPESEAEAEATAEAEPAAGAAVKQAKQGDAGHHDAIKQTTAADSSATNSRSSSKDGAHNKEHKKGPLGLAEKAKGLFKKT